jgi:hypothetical protein
MGLALANTARRSAGKGRLFHTSRQVCDCVRINVNCYQQVGRNSLSGRDPRAENRPRPASKAVHRHPKREWYFNTGALFRATTQEFGLLGRGPLVPEGASADDGAGSSDVNSDRMSALIRVGCIRCRSRPTKVKTGSTGLVKTAPSPKPRQADHLCQGRASCGRSEST